jgi:murein DD-endopeptidase MepM/ murein hydrolase activator NlpD
MLVKAETINRLRDELAKSRSDYAHLEKKDHEKDVQVASLGSLASEVSAIYGFTASKLTLAHHGKQPSAAIVAAKAPLKDENSVSDDSYYKSLSTFEELQRVALDGISTPTEGLDRSLGGRATLGPLVNLVDSEVNGANMPDMWPVMGPINSGFGQREDPVLGNGEGEFHKGVDIGAIDGTPVHAPASGRVVKAGMGTGYGREIMIDHGNGIATVYGHLSGFNVVAGQSVVKGEVIGYVGHTGRVTGPHLHYEVQVHGTAVNPHKYLRTTMAQLGGNSVGGR